MSTSYQRTAPISIIQNLETPQTGTTPAGTISHLNSIDLTTSRRHELSIPHSPSSNHSSSSLANPNDLHGTQSSIPYSFPKHWLWNTSLFYPRQNNIDPSHSHTFFTYPNNFSTIQSIRTSPSNTDKSINNNSTDLSSEDSQDNDDQSKIKTAKKRNPYSIEELLKKPEKRLKIKNDTHVITTSKPKSTMSLVSSEDSNDNLSKALNNDDKDSLNDERNYEVEICD